MTRFDCYISGVPAPPLYANRFVTLCPEHLITTLHEMAQDALVLPGPWTPTDTGVCSVCAGARLPKYFTRTGHALTEDDMERLAAEAEAGYDITKLRERGR